MVKPRIAVPSHDPVKPSSPPTITVRKTGIRAAPLAPMIAAMLNEVGPRPY